MDANLPALQRFLTLVSPEPNSGCWLWLGEYTSKNYGKLRVEPKSRRYQMATHVSKALFNDARPSPVHFALHKCDNPCCVNPDHLYWGTHQQNADDKVRRRRHKRHSENCCSRGHEYTPENTYLLISRNKRVCRTCARDNSNRHYHRVASRNVQGENLCHS